MQPKVLGICTFLAYASFSVGSYAQTVISWQGGGANNNWTTAENWNHPDAPAFPTGSFNESAVINNGDTVLVNSDVGSSLPAPNGPPGGLSVSNGSVLQVVSGGVFQTDDSGSEVDGSAVFTGGGTLSMVGPGTSFMAHSLSYSGGGVYNPVLTGSTHGLVSVAGALNLTGGVLQPTFDFPPSGSETWVIADASSITGQFSIDQSQSVLPVGLSPRASVVSGGMNGQQLVMSFANVLVLTVDMDSGDASISQPMGSSVDIIGYGIASATGQLAPESWSSFADQSDPGWNEAGTPTANNLDELAGPINSSTQGSQTISASATGVGNPFVVPTFQGPSADLSFQYVTSSGEFLEGQVIYTGLNTVNDLLLTVDPNTGDTELMNSSQTTLSLRGYSILSESGALKPGNGDWNSLADQGVTGIQEAGPDPTDLSELVPFAAAALVLTPGQSYQLGDLFATAGAQDLELEFLITEATGPVGDYSNDGVVDAADYTVWRDNLGGDGSMLLNRDPNNNGVVGQDDYSSWKTHFGETGGSGASYSILNGTVKYESLSAALASNVAVPEPSEFCYFVAMLGGVLWSRRNPGPLR